MNENAIVEVPLRIDEEGRVELEGDRSVRIDPRGERFGGYTEILEGLRDMKRPVFLEVDPDSGEVTQLLIPHVTRVRRIYSIDVDTVGIDLEHSHARHVLRRGGEDSAEIEAVLRSAQASGRTLVVTEDDAHRIIDVRPARRELDLPPPRPTFFALLRRQLSALIQWFVWYFFPISRTKARQVFDALNTLSCHPVNVPVPCIPFLYPDDGCWGRAHEMGRLMRGMSVNPRKVWIQGWLDVATRNNPQCEVHWGWHVAPTLRVRRWLWILGARTEVIDPALFTGPVAQATWKSVQNDPSASLTPTSADIFYLFDSSTDPDNSQTEGVLATYRLQLRNRSLNQGPPPYAHCG